MKDHSAELLYIASCPRRLAASPAAKALLESLLLTAIKNSVILQSVIYDMYLIKVIDA
jgi:hypothetical protein